MTTQPTQDAIVTQRDFEMAERLEEKEWPGNHAAWTLIIAQHFAAYRAESAAATIERCAGELDRRAIRYVERASQTDDAELRETRNECALAMEFAATALRNLKGQTS